LFILNLQCHHPNGDAIGKYDWWGLLLRRVAASFNKLINKDKKQLAVFVPQHFSQQFFAHY